MKKTFLLYFAKIPILPQFRLIKIFLNSSKKVFLLRARISGCVPYTGSKISCMLFYFFMFIIEAIALQFKLLILFFFQNSPPNKFLQISTESKNFKVINILRSFAVSYVSVLFGSAFISFSEILTPKNDNIFCPIIHFALFILKFKSWILENSCSNVFISSNSSCWNASFKSVFEKAFEPDIPSKTDSNVVIENIFLLVAFWLFWYMKIISHFH